MNDSIVFFSGGRAFENWFSSTAALLNNILSSLASSRLQVSKNIGLLAAAITFYIERRKKDHEQNQVFSRKQQARHRLDCPQFLRLEPDF